MTVKMLLNSAAERVLTCGIYILAAFIMPVAISADALRVAFKEIERSIASTMEDRQLNGGLLFAMSIAIWTAITTGVLTLWITYSGR